MVMVKRVESGCEGLSLSPTAPLKKRREKTKESKVCECVSLHGVSHG